MDWQLPLVILIVAGAIAYLGLQTWRSWSGRKKAGCGGGCCGKSAPSTQSDQARFIPADQVTLRRRESNLS